MPPQRDEPSDSRPRAETEGRRTEVDFSAEFRASFPRLWVYALSLVRTRSDADDVMQDAAIIAYRKLDSYKPGTNFRAWMSRIVQNVALNHRRRSRREALRRGTRPPAALSYLPDVAVGSRSPIGSDGVLHPEQRDLDDQVVAALMELDDQRRACLLLRCVEGLSYREIAEVVGCPEGTVMSHVHRARLTLAERLGASSGHRGGEAAR